MATVLIIDDEPGFIDLLKVLVRRIGHELIFATTLTEGLNLLYGQPVAAVILDVHLPDGNGLTKVRDIITAPSNPEIIVLTGVGDPDDAVRSIHDGVWDYLQKPFEKTVMLHTLKGALEFHAKKTNPLRHHAIDREQIVGSSPALSRAIEQLAQTAGNDGNVLISGETGTGKELFAQAVHRNSTRAEKNFVVVDCASLPENLVASVLFGHAKGAFTGANSAHEGLVKQADGGTLFLDEIGEMPLSLQKAFLRVLESRRFRPVGGQNEISSDFRLISSTNRDLDEMVAEGTFRQDLLFRLRSFHIQLPPLRERGDDIRELALYHTQRLCRLINVPTKSLAPDLLTVLSAYRWPGNVRELINTLTRAVGMAPLDPVLFSGHLPKQIRVHAVLKRIGRRSGKAPLTSPCIDDFRELPSWQTVRELSLQRAESDYLHRLLAASKNASTACSRSGLSRSRFYELLKKHNLLKSGPLSSISCASAGVVRYRRGTDHGY